MAANARLVQTFRCIEQTGLGTCIDLFHYDLASNRQEGEGLVVEKIVGQPCPPMLLAKFDCSINTDETNILESSISTSG